MTELMSPTRLREIADFGDLHRFTPSPTVLVLRWTIDEEAGTPVNHWLLVEKQKLPALSLKA